MRHHEREQFEDWAGSHEGIELEEMAAEVLREHEQAQVVENHQPTEEAQEAQEGKRMRLVVEIDLDHLAHASNSFRQNIMFLPALPELEFLFHVFHEAWHTVSGDECEDGEMFPDWLDVDGEIL